MGISFSVIIGARVVSTSILSGITTAFNCKQQNVVPLCCGHKFCLAMITFTVSGLKTLFEGNSLSLHLSYGTQNPVCWEDNWHCVSFSSEKKKKLVLILIYSMYMPLLKVDGVYKKYLSIGCLKTCISIYFFKNIWANLNSNLLNFNIWLILNNNLALTLCGKIFHFVDM